MPAVHCRWLRKRVSYLWGSDALPFRSLARKSGVNPAGRLAGRVLPNPKVVINHVGVANKLPLGRKKCGRGKPASVVHLLGRAISEYHWLPSVTLLIRKYLRYLRSISDKHSTRYNRQCPTDLNPWLWLRTYPSWLQLFGQPADYQWDRQQHQKPKP